MTTLESLSQITSDRIIQKTGLIAPSDADPYILSQLAHRLGFLTGYDFPFSIDHAQYLSQANVTGVTRALAEFGYTLSDPDLGDPFDAVIWTQPVEGGADHSVIATDFMDVTGNEWNGISFRDSAGGYLIEIDGDKPTVVLDDRWQENYALREAHLDALQRTSRLLNVARICIAHTDGKYTLFNEGKRIIKTLRNT